MQSGQSKWRSQSKKKEKFGIIYAVFGLRENKCLNTLDQCFDFFPLNFVGVNVATEAIFILWVKTSFALDWCSIKVTTFLSLLWTWNMWDSINCLEQDIAPTRTWSNLPYKILWDTNLYELRTTDKLYQFTVSLYLASASGFGSDYFWNQQSG